MRQFRTTDRQTRCSIYFDHAATAGHRPPSVREAMIDALEEASANPGRSGHQVSLRAARVVDDARRELATLLRAPDPAHLVLTKNATEAINLILLGFLREGDRVLAGSYEHNAALRCLRELERSRSISLEFVPPGQGCALDLDALRAALRAHRARLLVLNAASNVTGEIAPIAEAARLCRETSTAVLLDAAQAAGVVDIDLERDPMDFVALTGHKSLYGPAGTGAAYIRHPDQVAPLIRGGTGSRSEDETQPGFPPDRFEAGTANVPGLAGLAAGVRFVRERKLETIREHQTMLAERLTRRLRELDGVTIRGPCDAARQLAVISFTAVHPVRQKPWDPAIVAHALDRRGIFCRPGLHCAPRAHRTLGTFPTGTVRFSLSLFNTVEEIDTAVEAVREIIRKPPDDR